MHPIAIVIQVIRKLKESIFPFITLLIVGGGSDYIYTLILAAIIILFSVVAGYLKWLTFTYDVGEEAILIRQGIFVKKRRYIPFERIHSIDRSEGILQRVFSLVKLTVDTAGSSDEQGEAVLSAIKKEEASRIQELLDAARNGKETVGLDEEDEVLFQMSLREIWLMALTSGGVGVVIAGGFALVLDVADNLDIRGVLQEMESFFSVASIFIVAALILGLLLIAYMAASVGMMLKYANFTVRKKEDELIITRGLLEKRSLTIPLHKIQAVRISENLIRQPFGLAAVILETASGSIQQNENAEVMLFPLISKERIPDLLGQAAPDYRVPRQISPLPPCSLPRYLIRQWLIWIPLIGVIIYIFKSSGVFSLTLLLFGTWLGYSKFRAAGWRMDDDQLALSRRGLAKHMVLLKKNKIQSVSMRQSIFQRRKQLGTIVSYSKTGAAQSRVAVVDLEAEDARKIKVWFRSHK
ncbi:MAG: PH domain-containing protein [Bacillus sp. (in: firmicutes)]